MLLVKRVDILLRKTMDYHFRTCLCKWLILHIWLLWQKAISNIEKIHHFNFMHTLRYSYQIFNKTRYLKVSKYKIATLFDNRNIFPPKIDFFVSFSRLFILFQSSFYNIYFIFTFTFCVITLFNYIFVVSSRYASYNDCFFLSSYFVTDTISYNEPAYNTNNILKWNITGSILTTSTVLSHKKVSTVLLSFYYRL